MGEEGLAGGGGGCCNPNRCRAGFGIAKPEDGKWLWDHGYNSNLMRKPGFSNRTRFHPDAGASLCQASLCRAPVIASLGPVTQPQSSFPLVPPSKPLPASRIHSHLDLTAIQGELNQNVEV